MGKYHSGMKIEGNMRQDDLYEINVRYFDHFNDWIIY